MDNSGGCIRYRSVKSANVTARNVNSKPKVRWGATSAKSNRNRQINSEDSIPVAPYITHGWGEWCDSEGSEGKEEEETFSVRDRFHRKVVFNNVLRCPLERNRISYSAPIKITKLLTSKTSMQVQNQSYCRDNSNRLGSRGFTSQFPIRRDVRTIFNQTYEWVPHKREVEEEKVGDVTEKLEISLVNIAEKKKKTKRKERKGSQAPITGRAGLLALHFDPKLSRQKLQISSLITESMKKKKAPPTPAPSPPAPSPLFDCSAVLTK